MKELMSIKPTGTPPGMDPQAYMSEALDKERVSPEEQKQYDRFVLRAVQFIDGEKTQPQVLRMLNQPDLPVHEAVGRTAARIAQLIAGSAKNACTELAPDVIYHAGQEIVETLMETGAAAQILPLDPESDEYQDVLNMAFLEGVKTYGENLLQGPDAQRLSLEAGDFYARQVAEEVDRGEVEPGFFEQTPVASGVKEALGRE